MILAVHDYVVPMVIARTVVILAVHDSVVPMVIARTVVMLVVNNSVVERTELDAAGSQSDLLPMRMLLILQNTLSNEAGTKIIFPVLAHFQEVSCCKLRPRFPVLPTKTSALTVLLYCRSNLALP